VDFETVFYGAGMFGYGMGCSEGLLGIVEGVAERVGERVGYAEGMETEEGCCGGERYRRVWDAEC
jgi:hypothetical protein